MAQHYRKFWPLALAAAVLAAEPADAETLCPEGTVCAADPDGIAALIRSEGYKAKVGTAEDGDPMIESAASGYDFDLYFYDCTDKKACKSLQFWINFKDDGTNTPELANKWNQSKRFLQMAVNENNTLSVSYDVTTVGGLTPANFADILDWWAVMLSQVHGFFSENAGQEGETT